MVSAFNLLDSALLVNAEAGSCGLGLDRRRGTVSVAQKED